MIAWLETMNRPPLSSALRSKLTVPSGNEAAIASKASAVMAMRIIGEDM
jgi:hypothetical protein